MSAAEKLATTVASGASTGSACTAACRAASAIAPTKSPTIPGRRNDRPGDVGLAEEAFDLGVSFTAFHWLDEDSALVKIANSLRPNGWWAAAWNVFGDDSRHDPFHEATKEILEAPASPSAGERGIPFGLDSVARLAALKRTGAFDVVENKTSRWSLVLDADQTVALYATYSNVTARLDREAVLAEIGCVARDVFMNRVVRNMTTCLYIARRAG